MNVINSIASKKILMSFMIDIGNQQGLDDDVINKRPVLYRYDDVFNPMKGLNFEFR